MRDFKYPQDKQLNVELNTLRFQSTTFLLKYKKIIFPPLQYTFWTFLLTRYFCNYA